MSRMAKMSSGRHSQTQSEFIIKAILWCMSLSCRFLGWRRWLWKWCVVGQRRWNFRPTCICIMPKCGVYEVWWLGQTVRAAVCTRLSHTATANFKAHYIHGVAKCLANVDSKRIRIVGHAHIQMIIICSLRRTDRELRTFALRWFHLDLLRNG